METHQEKLVMQGKAVGVQPQGAEQESKGRWGFLRAAAQLQKLPIAVTDLLSLPPTSAKWVRLTLCAERC